VIHPRICEVSPYPENETHGMQPGPYAHMRVALQNLNYFYCFLAKAQK